MGLFIRAINLFWLVCAVLQLLAQQDAIAETRILFSHEKISFEPTPAIERVDADGTDRVSLTSFSSAEGPLGMAIDITHGKVYWTERDYKIRRANLDGTSIEDLITSGLSTPWGIALDVPHGKMYFSDTAANTINRANLDGSNVEVITSSVSNPTSIDIDLTHGYIYFSEYNNDRIRRCNLDGSSLTTIIASIDYPTGISVDLAGGKIYYGAAGSAPGLYRADLNGSNQQLITSSSLASGVRKDPFSSVVYFNSYSQLKKINTDGTSETIIVSSTMSQARDLAILGDPDNDNILDGIDNCQSISNAAQTDTDGDLSGDACDSDDDNDGTLDVSDNCPLLSSSSQIDTDGDSTGDACDTDDDNDGVVDGSDNCSLVANASQANNDADGNGDDCDSDDDNDGVTDGSDNCQFTANSSQTNSDGDANGDACDNDDDNDLIADSSDNCPLVSNSSQTNTDDDSSGDACDSDDDDDGLSDSAETVIGSNPLSSDSDHDGVSDGQEVTDGTSPTDSGSQLRVLGTTMCAEWNGFFQGRIWNIMEHVNLSGSIKSVSSTLYNIDGVGQSTVDFSVAAGGQTDLLVHDMNGRSAESYGKVCSTVASATPDIDGRMVYYFPADGSYDFAFAMPFLKGLAGNQIVSFNTFQPSLNSLDANNLVTDWIQITNLGVTSQTGSINFYGQDGSTLASSTVSIAGGARVDFSGHQFGKNLVGTAEWAPDDQSALFQVRNVRYFYNNPGTANRFSSAVQLAGEKGSGENLVAPLDTSAGTAVVEIANARASTSHAAVTIYRADGTIASSSSLTLPAHGSTHIIADSILNGTVGSVAVDATEPEGVVVNVLHYGRASSGSINFIFETSGLQAVGSVLRGSYNTFLGQDCDLYLINSSSSATTATLTMTREDGTNVVNGDVLSLPAHGLIRQDLCLRDQDNTYGVVTVQPGSANSIGAYVVRRGQNDAYRFSTPVRQ